MLVALRRDYTHIANKQKKNTTLAIAEKNKTESSPNSAREGFFSNPPLAAPRKSMSTSHSKGRSDQKAAACFKIHLYRNQEPKCDNTDLTSTILPMLI